MTPLRAPFVPSRNCSFGTRKAISPFQPCVRQPSEHEVQDVVDEIVIAGRDENFGR